MAIGFLGLLPQWPAPFGLTQGGPAGRLPGSWGLTGVLGPPCLLGTEPPWLTGRAPGLNGAWRGWLTGAGGATEPPLAHWAALGLLSRPGSLG